MRYPTLLFDLDHTLFDSDASLVQALEVALVDSGVDYGIATCGYNPDGRTADLDVAITHGVRTLAEIHDVVIGMR